MSRRRNKPDGLPFRLYKTDGVRVVSYYYKKADGTRVFNYTAPKVRADLVAQIRKRAIDEAEMLNGNAPAAGTVSDLIDRYFQWQEGVSRTDERRKAESTLIENRRERKWLDKFFDAMSPDRCRFTTYTLTSMAGGSRHQRRRTKRLLCCQLSLNTGAV